MLLNKRNKQIAIILTVMVMAMLSMLLQTEFQVFYSSVRALMVVATTLGLIGVLKKDPQHKDKILFIWMCLSGVLFFAYSFSCMEYFLDMIESYYRIWDILPNFFGTIAGTIFVGCLIACISQDFQELRQCSFPAHIETSSLLNAPNKPAPLDNATTDNLRVTVQT